MFGVTLRRSRSPVPITVTDSSELTERRVTEQGQALTKEILSLAVEERHSVFAGFSDSELRTLSDSLDRVNADVRWRLSTAESGRS